MNERERFDALLSVLSDLKEANRTTPVLVEGQRDVAVLRALGCKGEVLTIHNGRALFEVAEILAEENRRAIILTDWDRRGTRLAEQLTHGLTANGVTADTTYRDAIASWVKLQLKDVEALLPYVTRGLARWHRTTLEDHERGLALG